MRKVCATMAVLASLLAVGGCGPQMLAAPSVTKISAEEMLTLLKRTFPHLENGKTLFVTTGEYWAYPVASYDQVFRTLSQSEIPQCRYKGAIVVLGEMHRALDKLVAAGIAMGQPSVSPAWFVLLIDNNRMLYGLDPATGNRWQLKSNSIALLII